MAKNENKEKVKEKLNCHIDKWHLKSPFKRINISFVFNQHHSSIISGKNKKKQCPYIAKVFPRNKKWKIKEKATNHTQLKTIFHSKKKQVNVSRASMLNTSNCLCGTYLMII